VDLSTREFGGHVVVALRGELDIADAAAVAARLAAVAAREPQIIVDLSGLEFIDSCGVAALARGRKHARHAGGDLLLAAPRQLVLRVLTMTRLADGFGVHATMEKVASGGHPGRRPCKCRGGPAGWAGPASACGHEREPPFPAPTGRQTREHS
jgi:anti-sigma B factor antagonist